VKEGDGEEVENDDAAATFPQSVAPVGASSAAAAGLYGEWRGDRRSCCCAKQRRIRKDQVTRRDSVAIRATFDNRRLAAEQRIQISWSVTTNVPRKGCCAVDAGAGNNWVKAHYTKAWQ
jgi:hypothetical protein